MIDPIDVDLSPLFGSRPRLPAAMFLVRRIRVHCLSSGR